MIEYNGLPPLGSYEKNIALCMITLMFVPTTVIVTAKEGDWFMFCVSLFGSFIWLDMLVHNMNAKAGNIEA